MSTPASLKKIGLLMSGWHSSMSDPIYAVESFFVNGKNYPYIKVVREAESGLRRDLDGAKRKLHGWGPREVKELTTILSFLKKYIASHPGGGSGGGGGGVKPEIKRKRGVCYCCASPANVRLCSSWLDGKVNPWCAKCEKEMGEQVCPVKWEGRSPRR